MSGIPQLNPIGTPTSLTSNMIGSSFPTTINPNGAMGAALGIQSLGNVVSSFNPMSMLTQGIGSLIGGAFDIWKQNRQWKKQEEWYNKYQSPQAQMQQMAEAGINPNTAAAGIAGNGAGQSMSPTSVNSIGGQLGSLIGGSYNSAVDAASTQMMTKQAQAQTRDLEASADNKMLQNDMLRVQLGLEPERIKTEIQEKRQNAILLGQKVLESKQAVENAKAEEKNIRQQYNNLVAEEGETKAKERLDNASAAAAKADAAYKSVMTTLEKNSPEGQYAYAVLKYGPDSDEAKAALKRLEEYEYRKARGQYNADPEHYQFNSALDAKNELPKLLDEYIQQQKDLTYEYMRGNLKRKEYFDRDKEIRNNIEEVKKLINSADKAFAKEAYKNGYHTQWQNSVDSMVKGLSTGVGIGLGAAVGAGVNKTGVFAPKRRPII